MIGIDEMVDVGSSASAASGVAASGTAASGVASRSVAASGAAATVLSFSAASSSSCWLKAPTAMPEGATVTEAADPASRPMEKVSCGSSSTGGATIAVAS